MYICNCRGGITEKAVQKYLEDHRNLPKAALDWKKVSEALTGEKMACGTCRIEGRKTINRFFEEELKHDI